MKATTRKALNHLMNAIAHRAQMNGEAQWTNGYRCGKGGDDQALYQKELRQWKFCGDAEANVEAKLRAYVRAVRAEARGHE